jgi:EAL domain-containing protein (putative c-di-GMP-specific phosphodiesterase class I)
LRLIHLGCDVGQGNGIAEAMPTDEVDPWVRSYRNPFVPPRQTEAV